MSGKDDFLARWSERKRGLQTEEPEPAAKAPDAAPALEEDPRSDEEILADLGLKHPETLGPGDDIRGFMAAAVPDRLRRMALRQLWRMNPVLANVDGLVDYGEDFTDAAMVIENLQSVYKVGRGMWRDEDEEVAAKPAERDASPVAEDATAPEDAVALDAPEAGSHGEETPSEEVELAESAAEPADEPDHEAPDPAERAPRRMHFRFSEG